MGRHDELGVACWLRCWTNHWGRILPKSYLGKFTMHLELLDLFILVISHQRWIFWISFPFSAMSYLLVILFLRVDERIKAFRSIIKEVDWVGSVLFVSSLTSFLIPLSWVRNKTIAL